MDIVTAPAEPEPLILIGCPDGPHVAQLTAMLASAHYSVETAEQGAQALLRLQASDPPPIALLDLDLPSPGGAEIVRILSRGPDRRRSWLVLAGARAASGLHVALEAGCDDFLALPPDPLELKLRLRVADRMRILRHAVQRQTDELAYQSAHDPLTGLWNREAVLRLIFQETDRVRRLKEDLCLMLIDLDEFERINHDYGYHQGDKVLSGLADRFRRQMRSYDLIGRCGEDEFLLALPGCDRQNAFALAERIRTTLLSRPFAVGSEATTLTASFGIASSRGRSPLVVLREAERALAEAKLAGKNCVRCFEPVPQRALDGFLLTDAVLLTGPLP